MNPVRILIAVAAAIAGAGWAFGAPNPFTMTAGVLFFALVAVAALVEGFAANYWSEALALAGIFVVFMGPRAGVLGGIMMAPAIMVYVGRAWGHLQSEVIKAAEKRGRTGDQN